MPLYWIWSGMTASVILFYLGFFVQKHSLKLHITCNTLGILFNLATAIYLLFLKYFGGGMETNLIFRNATDLYIHIHRFFAALGLFWMLFQAYIGITRKLSLHRRSGKFFLLYYSIIYISGLYLFKVEP